MSTTHDLQSWWGTKEVSQNKYEKCRNITEEIYKRINITFEIKKLESGELSDVSVKSAEIDSNDLSNGTDLFACDKSDSIPSSTEADRATLDTSASVTKYINNNNNEERSKLKRPKKKFRKRVKKRQSNQDKSLGSSDEETMPLSQMTSPDRPCTVPNIIIVTKGLTPKILNPEKRLTKKSPKQKIKIKDPDYTMPKNKEYSVKKHADTKKSVEVETALEKRVEKKEETKVESKSCTLCSQMFKGERGLRRHMAMSHISDQEPTRPEREIKPA